MASHTTKEAVFAESFFVHTKFVALKCSLLTAKLAIFIINLQDISGEFVFSCNLLKAKPIAFLSGILTTSLHQRKLHSGQSPFFLSKISLNFSESVALFAPTLLSNHFPNVLITKLCQPQVKRGQCKLLFFVCALLL